MVALPVTSSMGAQGRNTAFQGPMDAEVTNDGVTIARIIHPEDPFENLGAEMMKQSAEQTNREVGDGTSGSIALSDALTDEMVDVPNPMQIRRELNADKDVLVAKLKEIAVSCETREQLLDVARTSVEDESIAEIVVDSVMKAGEYGAVVVQEGVGYTIEKEEVQGYWWEQGYVSPYMLTTDRGECVLEDVPIILTDRNISLNTEILPLLEDLFKNGATQLFIVADNVEGAALSTLIKNKANGKFVSVAVRRPGTIEELEDIAVMTGATTVTKQKGGGDISRLHIGTAKKIVVTRDRAIVIGEDTEKVQNRIKEIEAELKENPDDELLKRRMGMLANGMVNLSVGAKTETERSYLVRKVQDAVLACLAALKEGIVPGGGVTLASLAQFAQNDILRQALLYPRKCILKNAGLPENDGSEYNVRTGKKVKDHFKEGIIDPAKVIRCEIENAISLAGAFVTIENLVVVTPESRREPAEQS